jgi:mannitol/fructose-specific phosphotransferase system IIA component (Ntr-type)
MIGTKESSVRLEDFLRKEDVHLGLSGATQSAVMRELASSLGLDAEGCSALLKGLQRRESMESPVRYVFLLVAPHLSPEYLPVLAGIAHLVNNPDFRRRLDELQSADEFLQLLADAGV